jgi:hypothetical protein
MQVAVTMQNLKTEPMKLFQLAGMTFDFRVTDMKITKQAVWFDPRDFSMFGDLTLLTNSNLGAFEEQAGFSITYDHRAEHFNIDFGIAEITPLVDYR